MVRSWWGNDGRRRRHRLRPGDRLLQAGLAADPVPAAEPARRPGRHRLVQPHCRSAQRHAHLRVRRADSFGRAADFERQQLRHRHVRAPSRGRARFDIRSGKQSQTFTLEDMRGPQTVRIEPPMTGARFVVEVLVPYPAEDPDQPVCLTDIVFFSAARHSTAPGSRPGSSTTSRGAAARHVVRRLRPHARSLLVVQLRRDVPVQLRAVRRDRRQAEDARRHLRRLGDEAGARHQGEAHVDGLRSGAAQGRQLRAQARWGASRGSQGRVAKHSLKYGPRSAGGGLFSPLREGAEEGDDLLLRPTRSQRRP